MTLPPFRPALLAFDLDGTLMPEQDTNLSAETSEILAEFSALGVKLAAITGRNSVNERIEREGYLHAHAANNGGSIYISGELRYQEQLTEEDVDFLLQHGLPHEPDSLYPTVFILSAAGYAVPQDCTMDEDWLAKYGVSRLTPEHRRTALKVRFSHSQAADYANHLRATQPHLVVTGGLEPYLNFVSVTPREATKSSALKRIAAALNIPLEHTVAFGDSDNDADMLETSEFAVQIGTHPHLTPHANIQLTEQSELNGYLRRLIKQLRRSA